MFEARREITTVPAHDALRRMLRQARLETDAACEAVERGGYVPGYGEQVCQVLETIIRSQQMAHVPSAASEAAAHVFRRLSKPGHVWKAADFASVIEIIDMTLA